jgi:hypothetical protein
LRITEEENEMGTNGFRDEELVSRKVNGQIRVFPVVGGRLRLAHEENENLSLQTELVSWDGQYAVVKGCAETGKGKFLAYGTANGQRDARLAESLIELAETRSIARALRFAGYGLEFTGAEEVSHVTGGQAGIDTSINLDAGGSNGSSNVNRPSSNGEGRATSAQVRALFALTKRAHYGDEDIRNLLAPLNAATFQDLTREDASRLISALQTEAAA